jgi:hypothetical protein
VYPVSTSFCVFIREFERRGEYKMSSVKIPNTYTRLRGNFFLYIIGDIPGLTTGLTTGKFLSFQVTTESI